MSNTKKKTQLKVATLFNFSIGIRAAQGFATNDPTIATLTISSFVADIKELK